LLLDAPPATADGSTPSPLLGQNVAIVEVKNNDPADIKEILETKASEVTFVEEDRMRGKPKPADCKPVRAPKLACINGRCVVGDLSY
jgi:hypothetical protein